MNRRTIARCVAAGTLAIAAPALYAQPASIPNGPRGDNDSIASLRTYDQLVAALESAVNSSRGAARLEYAKWNSTTGRRVRSSSSATARRRR